VRVGGDVFAGTCTAIRGDGKTGLFTFDTPKPIEIGDRIEIPRLLSLSVTGCTFTGLKAEPRYVPHLDWEGSVTGSRRFRLSLNSAAKVADTWIPGVLQHVTVDVITPFRGPVAGRYLVMMERLPQPRHTFLAIDLSVAGRRWLSPKSAEIASTDVVEIAGQRASRIPSGRYLGQLDCLFADRPDAGPLRALDSPSAAATVDVQFEVSSPLTALVERRLAMTP
jgi:hypothetical protein